MDEASHEPYPLIPSFSPSGGEGARRAVEGDSDRFMAPMRDSEIVEALHEPSKLRVADPRSGPRLCEAQRFMVPMHAKNERGLSMNLVGRASSRALISVLIYLTHHRFYAIVWA